MENDNDKFVRMMAKIYMGAFSFYFSFKLYMDYSSKEITKISKLKAN